MSLPTLRIGVLGDLHRRLPDSGSFSGGGFDFSAMPSSPLSNQIRDRNRGSNNLIVKIAGVDVQFAACAAAHPSRAQLPLFGPLRRAFYPGGSSDVKRKCERPQAFVGHPELHMSVLGPTCVFSKVARACSVTCSPNDRCLGLACRPAARTSSWSFGVISFFRLLSKDRRKDWCRHARRACVSLRTCMRTHARRTYLSKYKEST